MSIDLQLAAQIQQSIKQQNVPEVCQTVEVLSESKPKHQRILLVTYSEFAIYKWHNDSIVLKVKYPLHSITQISSIEIEKKITIDFGSEQIEIIAKNSVQIGYRILNTLCTLYNINELPQLQNLQPIGFWPDPALRLSLTKQITPEVFNDLRSKFDEDPDTFSLSTFSNYINNLPLLLESAQANIDIKDIFCDVQLTPEYIRAIAEFLPKNKNFTTLTFAESFQTANFDSIFSILSKGQNPLRKFKFKTQIDPSQFDFIVKIITSVPVETLEFDDCIDGNDASKLFDILSSIEQFQHIPKISLKSIDISSIDNLCNLFLCTKKISLDSCDIEVIPFLQKLTEVNKQIECINLRGNLGNTFNNTPIHLPKTLNKIKLDMISWKGATFIGLLPILLGHQPTNGNYRLSIAEVDISTSDWDHAFVQLNSIDHCSLSSLNWSYNSVGPKFFEWVNTIPTLKKLNISNCLKETPRIELMLKMLMHNARFIKELIIDNNGIDELSEELAKALIESIPKNYSLTSLSINNQSFNDELVRELCCALMSNRRIRKLSFDFSGISQEKTALNFFQTLSDRGVPLEIQYPTEVIEQFNDSLDDYNEAIQKTKNFFLFTSEKDGYISNLNHFYSIVRIGNKKVKAPPETVACVDENGQLKAQEAVEVRPVTLAEVNYDPVKRVEKNQIDQIEDAATHKESSSIFQPLTVEDLPTQPSSIQSGIYHQKPHEKISIFEQINDPTGKLSDKDYLNQMIRAKKFYVDSPEQELTTSTLPPLPDMPPPPSGSFDLPPQPGNLPPPPSNSFELPPLPDIPPPPSGSFDLPPQPLSNLPPIPNVNEGLPPPPSLNQLGNDLPPLPDVNELGELPPLPDANNLAIPNPNNFTFPPTGMQLGQSNLSTTFNGSSSLPRSHDSMALGDRGLPPPPSGLSLGPAGLPPSSGGFSGHAVYDLPPPNMNEDQPRKSLGAIYVSSGDDLPPPGVIPLKD